jgi:hypothetical protein
MVGWLVGCGEAKNSFLKREKIMHINKNQLFLIILLSVCIAVAVVHNTI